MKILISPAKSLDFENNIETSYSSSPLFADKALQINNTLKELSENTSTKSSVAMNEHE